MSTQPTRSFQVRRLDTVSSREFGGLCDVLMDCVEGGASVSFMNPMTLAKAAEFWRDVAASIGRGERALIVAEDAEGLLLIDQHASHERVLFDKYRSLEEARAAESQHLLLPETFDLTPAQAAAFDEVSDELERHGFGLMRLSGRTVAVRAVPADLPAGDARGLLAPVAQVEEAPLAPEMHLDRTGRRPVEADDLVASAHAGKT